jgi:hypothetical protein
MILYVGKVTKIKSEKDVHVCLVFSEQNQLLPLILIFAYMLLKMFATVTGLASLNIKGSCLPWITFHVHMIIYVSQIGQILSCLSNLPIKSKCWRRNRSGRTYNRIILYVPDIARILYLTTICNYHNTNKSNFNFLPILKQYMITYLNFQVQGHLRNGYLNNKIRNKWRKKRKQNQHTNRDRFLQRIIS